MGFFMGKRYKSGWHVGFGRNGFYVAKEDPDGSYFGWSADSQGTQKQVEPMTPRERAVVAGIILIVAGLMWWGLSAWDAQIKADQQAKAQEKLTAALTEQLQAIDVMKYHSALDIVLTPRENGRMDADIRYTLVPGKDGEDYLIYASAMLRQVDSELLDQLASVTLEAWEPIPGSDSYREWSVKIK